jgi:hypothetical protein
MDFANIERLLGVQPSNINPETGVRYGVVALHSLEDWVWEEFWQNGTNETWEYAKREWLAENPNHDEDSEEFQEWNESWECDEQEYSLECDGMKLELSYLGGAPLVFVLQSPYISRARECSPCVPNAGDLDSKDADGVECYDLPADWYRTDS